MIPPIDPTLFDRLKRQFHFGSWRNRNRLNEQLYVSHYFLRGTELPGWQPHRIQPVRLPQRPALVRSVWTPSAGGSAPGRNPLLHPPQRPVATADRLLHVDTFECAARQEAHEFLLQLLGEFHLPVAFQEQNQLGDVVFSAPDSQVILFARANLVFILRDVGQSPAPIAQPATELDQDLITKPEPVATIPARTARRGPRKGERKVRVGIPVPLPMDEVIREARPTWQPLVGVEAAPIPIAPEPMLKIFSRQGEIYEADSQIMFRAAAAGDDEVTLFAIEPGAQVTSHRWHYQAG